MADVPERGERMTHIDLFSGIGGFALAARANGIETVQFVEIDQRCRDFLSKAWPGVAIHDDIRTFDGTQHAGAYLLTAGVPCQPASRAGKQRGAADDRWLWPEALRVLREVAPAWCLFENPPGIGDLEFDRILSDVEAEGYEVEVLSVPACAVNAPHRRDRYWIVGRRVADALQVRLGEAEPRAQGQQRHATERDEGHMADTHEPRPEGADVRKGRRGTDGLRAECAEGNMADTGRLESGQNEPQRGAQGRAVDRRSCEERMDNSPEARCDGAQRYTESDSRNEAWLRMSCAGCQTHWHNFVWLPCADGKVRRAPDGLVGVAYGDTDTVFAELATVHRSALGALGNAIVWPVAARIIAAMLESEWETC